MNKYSFPQWISIKAEKQLFYMEKIKINTYSKRIIADTITPVEVYLKIRDKFPNSLLLESSDYMQAGNNYSFICFNQTGFFELKNHIINFKYPGKKSKEISEVLIKHDIRSCIKVK